MGGAPQKVPRPPSCGQTTTFFVEIFCYNPLIRKNNLTDLKVKFLPPPQPQLGQVRVHSQSQLESCIQQPQIGYNTQINRRP